MTYRIICDSEEFETKKIDDVINEILTASDNAEFDGHEEIVIKISVSD